MKRLEFDLIDDGQALEVHWERAMREDVEELLATAIIDRDEGTIALEGEVCGSYGELRDVVIQKAEDVWYSNAPFVESGEAAIRFDADQVLSTIERKLGPAMKEIGWL